MSLARPNLPKLGEAAPAPREETAFRALASPPRFARVADDAVRYFEGRRADVLARVRSGDVTPKAAREELAGYAAQIREHLTGNARGLAARSPVFFDVAVKAKEARDRANASPAPDALQRETVRLLRELVVEQQMTTRKAEFEGRAFARRSTTAAPAPTIASVLAFHKRSVEANDDAAVEWSRRQLEALRPLTIDPAELHKIDVATMRPGSPVPHLAETMVERLKADPWRIEGFVNEVTKAGAGGDATAALAAGMLAREAFEAAEGNGAAVPAWAGDFAAKLAGLPTAALAHLVEGLTRDREAEVEASVAHAEHALSTIDRDAALKGVEAPTNAELQAAERGRYLSNKPLVGLPQTA